MARVMCQRLKISYFLPMIPTYFFPHNDANQVIEIVNNESKKRSSWFQANKLSINIKKSNFILFKTKKKGKNLTYIFQLMILKLIV